VDDLEERGRQSRDRLVHELEEDALGGLVVNVQPELLLQLRGLWEGTEIRASGRRV
jgi:hypothetical protein